MCVWCVCVCVCVVCVSVTLISSPLHVQVLILGAPPT